MFISRPQNAPPFRCRDFHTLQGMSFLYDLLTYLIYPGIKAAGLFNDKARRLARGQKGNIGNIEKTFGEAVPDTPTVWVHCASLGEFEQGRPVIETLRDKRPEWRIVVTFFSPSGYEVRKDYAGADHIFYLPVDTPSNARRFVDAVKPDMAIFVKYEYWYNYLSELRRRDIPAYFISAVFRPGMRFFKFYGGFFRRMLNMVTRFFVQDQQSARLLGSIGLEGNVTVSGDTRFDRVELVRQLAADIPVIERFASGDQPVMVCGSTWPADEQILLLLMRARPELKFIVVPHEIDHVAVANLMMESGRQALRYTALGEQDDLSGASLLVVDTVGLLSKIYRYGDVTYVGGGFGAGIHNILEAAVWGKPVIFGPRFGKFNEAVDLVAAGAGFPVGDYNGLNTTLSSLLSNPEKLAAAGATAARYVESNLGATERIVEYLLGED